MGSVKVIDHPLVQHKLSIMRRKETSVAKFRLLLQEISMLLGYEVTRDLPLANERIETPLMEMDAPMLDGKKVVVVSILRAGGGIVDGILKILPSARVGHVGLYRDPKTLQAVEYYNKMHPNMTDRDAIVVDLQRFFDEFFCRSFEVGTAPGLCGHHHDDFSLTLVLEIGRAHV